MSFDYNYKFWVATHRDLKDILKRQEAFKKLKPIDDKRLTHEIFAELYARYVELVNKLSYIYRYAFQVQKREIIEKLVESATKRLLELKKELQKLELSEFIYVDKTLVQKKLTPNDITILRPQYFPYWRPWEVQDIINESRIQHQLGELLKQCEYFEKLKDEKHAKKFIHPNPPIRKMPKSKSGKYLTLEDLQKPNMIVLRGAILQLQNHERARKCRLQYLGTGEETTTKLRVAKTMIYDFTYKPDQTMLIPVKRTKFAANYYLDKKGITSFSYYVKPPFTPFTTTFLEPADDESTFSDESEAWNEDEFEMEAEDELSQFNYEIEDNSINCESSSSGEGLVRQQSTRGSMVLQVFQEAARLIQAVWRNYQQRKYNKLKVDKEYLVLGMTDERVFKNRLKAFDQAMEDNRVIRTKKEKLDQEFIAAIEDEKTRILRVKGPWIMEDISDHIRAWFREFYDGLEEFHPYPDAIKGGTILLVRGETMTPLELSVELKKKPKTKEDLKKEKEKAKAKKAKEKAKLKKEAAAKLKRKKQMAARGIYDISDELASNKNIAQIEETMQTYKKEWEFIDEQLNKTHAPIMSWISADKFAEVHQELRIIVDELMRIEYELLQKALAKDKKRKYKPKKPKKPKKGKKGGKRAKKEPKDLTADRTLESLFAEMEAANLIVNYKRRTIEEFIGEYNYCAYDYRNIVYKETPPRSGEIKDILREFVLGFGPLNINKPKSVCLAGPARSGKKMLIEILATEIDAVVIDLSPENTEQYADNLPYLIHLVNKVSKLVQPTIILVKEVQRIFLKKLTPEAKEHKYNLLEKDFFKKIVKPLKPSSKVFVMGTTSAPWMAKAKMKKCFQNFLLLPQTDYGTAFLVWRTIGLNQSGVPRDYLFTPLAILTNKYTTGDIRANIEETLNIRRRILIKRMPVKPEEFINGLIGPIDSDIDPKFPPEDKEMEKFNKWYRRVNKLAKQRAAYVKKLDAIRESKLKSKKKK